MLTCFQARSMSLKFTHSVWSIKKQGRRRISSTSIMRFISSRWSIIFFSIKSRQSLSRRCKLQECQQERIFQPPVSWLLREQSHSLKLFAQPPHWKITTHQSKLRWELSTRREVWLSPSWQRSTLKLRVHSLSQELMLPTCRLSPLQTPTTKANCSLVSQWPLTPRNCMLLERLQRWNFSKSLSRNSQKGLEHHCPLQARNRQDLLK